MEAGPGVKVAGPVPSAAAHPPGLSWAGVSQAAPSGTVIACPSLAKSEADVSSEPIAGSGTDALGMHNQHEDALLSVCAGRRRWLPGQAGGHVDLSSNPRSAPY